MPQYSYQCKLCLNEYSISLSIKDFKSLCEKDISEMISCKNCNNPEFIRKFVSPFGKIERDKQELSRIAKEEAKVIVNKIKKGDEETIRDIYGKADL